MPLPPMPVLTTGRFAFTWRGTGPAWFRMTPSRDLVPEARQFTRALLSENDPDYIHDAEVVTSELVTNAVNYALDAGAPPRHVVPGIWLGVQALKRYVHLFVRDPYPVIPVKNAAGETDTSGRGLFIVEALSAACWGDFRTFDKTMHAVIAKPGVVLTEDELDGPRHR
jgi:hypothetical protein